MYSVENAVESFHSNHQTVHFIDRLEVRTIIDDSALNCLAVRVKGLNISRSSENNTNASEFEVQFLFTFKTSCAILHIVIEV